MSAQKFRNLGFTLIELLVAVTIGMILVSGGLAAYRGFGEKQTLKQGGSTLVTNLRSFQQKSLSGEKPAECEVLSSDRLEGYRVSYVDNQTYSVEADCLTANPGANNFSLPDGVVFSSGFSDIFFPVLRTNVEGGPFPLVITLISGTLSYEVTVEISGVVKGELL